MVQPPPCVLGLLFLLTFLLAALVLMIRCLPVTILLLPLPLFLVVLMPVSCWKSGVLFTDSSIM